MNRRTFLASTAVSTLAGGATVPRRTVHAAPADATEPTTGWRRFEVTTRVTLLDAPGPGRLWLPLAQTAGDYQTALAPRWQGTGRAGIVSDLIYGADMLHIVWDEASDEPKTTELVQIVTTRDRQGPKRMLPVTDAERRFWMQPTDSMPTDGIVHDTAQRIVAGTTNPRARLRAIYDWVVDNTSRNPATPGCGLGDIETMLKTGNLSGKCADINGLMTGLARAAGFPARDVYGIRVAPSHQFPSLGTSSDVISKSQHCRSEVYLQDAGWFPVDPADVRKAILEQKLPLDSPQIRLLRDRLFGTWEMNWIGYNSATDIVLPGADGKQPNFAFLMYPCAFTTTGQPDSLDPAHFRYEITSREATT